MFIQQAFKVLHEPWRYVVGLLVVFIGVNLGGAPLVLHAGAVHLANGGDPEALENTNVLLNVLDSNTTFFYMLLSFAVGLVFLFGWTRWSHKQKLLSLTTSRPKMDWGRFFFAFGLITTITLVLTYLDFSANSENYELQFNLAKFIPLAVIAIIMIPLQAGMEEYVFRGYLMQGLGTTFNNRWLPLLITSILFGGLHFMNPEVDKLGNIVMVYYIGTGFFLGILTLMDRGLELALGFHIGVNLTTALLVTADWTVFKTNSVLKDIAEPETGITVILPVVIMYPIILAIMAYKYKWKDWKSRLFGSVYPVEEQSILDSQ